MTAHEQFEPSEPSQSPATPLWRRVDFIGLILGPLFLIGWLTLKPGVWDDPGQRLLGVWILTILWWITEPIPIPVTGLLAVCLALMLGIPQQALPPVPGQSINYLKVAFAPFAEPSVFFLMGGMYLGLAMTRHGLDRRFALSILCAPGMGRSPARVLLAMGIAVLLLSTVISNTAATAIVYPIALRVLALLDAGQTASGRDRESISKSHYGTALLLMCAYASSVGGVATPIGTTTNVLARGLFEQKIYFGKTANFLHWMTLGVPVMLLLFTGLYLGLRWYGRRAVLNLGELNVRLREMRAGLGPWKRGEWNTLLVFLAAMTAWTIPGVLSMVDKDLGDRLLRVMPEELIAVLIPVALFLLPVDRRFAKGTLAGDDLSRIDWGALLLFGAGLSLGALVRSTNLAGEWAGQLQTWWPTTSPFLLIGAAAFAGIFLSEFTSNAAAAQILIPIVWAVCEKLKIDPLGPMMAVTFAASFGSALPVSTPPNTLVYSSGKIPLRRMAVVGIAFDVLCWLAVWVGVATAVSLEWSPWLD